MRVDVVDMGLDWARHDLAVVFGFGQVKKRRKVRRDRASIEAVVAEALALGGKDARVRARIEAGDEGVVRLLAELGVETHVTDAKQATRYRESRCSSGAKDDFRDAENLMRMLSSGDHTVSAWREPTEATVEARVLLAWHDELMTKIGRASNQLRELLVRVNPAMERALGSVTTVTALDVLDLAPTWSEGNAITSKQFARFVKAHPHIGMAMRQAIEAALAEPWVRLGATAQTLGADRVRSLVSELRHLVSEQREVDVRIATYAGECVVGAQLRSIKGVGPLLVTALVAASDAIDLSRRDALSVACGASPVEHSSGKMLQTRMRTSAPARSRSTMHLVATQAVRHHGWAKAQYADARSRGKSHGTALRIVGRSLLRLVSAMLRDGTEYDPDRYVAGLVAHGIEWAVALQQAGSLTALEGDTEPTAAPTASTPASGPVEPRAPSNAKSPRSLKPRVPRGSMGGESLAGAGPAPRHNGRLRKLCARFAKPAAARESADAIAKSRPLVTTPLRAGEATVRDDNTKRR